MWDRERAWRLGKEAVRMRLVIFGSTGPTGRRLVERCIAEGHEVRAFARDPAKLKASHGRLSVFGGDAFDPRSVEEAVAGAEAVVSVLGGEPSNPLKAHRPPDPDGPASAGARNIVRAMRGHNVGRLVYQSAWGVGDSKENRDLYGEVFTRALQPLLLRDDYADKEAAEAEVKDSGLDWVIARPMILTNGPWTGSYRVGEDLEPGPRPFISRADVAQFLSARLAGDDFLGGTPAIGYPGGRGG